MNSWVLASACQAPQSRPSPNLSDPPHPNATQVARKFAPVTKTAPIALQLSQIVSGASQNRAVARLHQKRKCRLSSGTFTIKRTMAFDLPMLFLTEKVGCD